MVVDGHDRVMLPLTLLPLTARPRRPLLLLPLTGPRPALFRPRGLSNFRAINSRKGATEEAQAAKSADMVYPKGPCIKTMHDSGVYNGPFKVHFHARTLIC